MSPYNIYPSVDETYNFPTNIRKAVANSTEVKATASAAAAEVKWTRPINTNIASVDDYITPGLFPITRSTIANRPVLSLTSGTLEVMVINDVISHRWTTPEAVARTFNRTRVGGVWSEWINSAWSDPVVVSGTGDFNSMLTPGTYRTTSGSTLNKPTTGIGHLEVLLISTGNLIQRWTPFNAASTSHVRYYVGGVWKAWEATTWYLGVPVKGTDFNTLTTAGQFNITFVDHPNQPDARVGALTVTLGGTRIVQVFEPSTDTYDSYRRVRTSNAEWGPWTTPNQKPATPDKAISTLQPLRSEIQKWNPTRYESNPSEIITAMTVDRTVGFNSSNSTGNLRETRDNGTTWTTVYTFPGALGWVKPLDNGELMATIQNDPLPREVWVSKGYGTDQVTWTKTLTASAPNITFAKAWSVGVYKNMIFLNEYGPKGNMSVGGYVAPSGKNARYTYMSLDYGKTWNRIFDLNEFLLSQPGVTTADDVHLHGVTWDPYWDRIWITFGDAMNGTLYSDDLGATWNIAHFAATYSGGHQNVGIVALPQTILFGTDGYPNGIQRITRDQGKHKNTYTIDQPYTINPGVNDLTHLCQAIHKVEREGGDGPVFFGFGAETASVASHIVATYDGYTFTKVWEDSVAQPAGYGIRSIAGPTLKGQLIVGSNDQRVANKWSKWQGPIGIY